LLEVLTSGKPATARQLADIFDIEAPLVHYHLGLLEEAGFITGERMLGKRGKIYSAVGKSVRVNFNSESALEQERANQLADSWLRASMTDILNGLTNQDDDENTSQVIFNWESLSEEDISQIKKHFDGVQTIMTAAKDRRYKASLEAQRPTCHVLFSVVSKDFSMPPNPEFSSLIS
jgi:predicted ArsR family transcriptional regulator